MTASGAVDEVGIFIGANRQAHVFDYKDNLVAYGAYTTVALWNPFSIDKKGVYRTLVKHTKEVTCVRFIPGTDLLVSAGEDGEINVWKKSGDTYNLIQTLVEEDVSITCISVFDEHYFVTGNTRGEVTVYKIEDTRISLAYRYKVKFNFFALTLCLQKIDTAYLLLIGGTGTSLFVYTFTPTEGPKLQASVPGHEDWIKALAIAKDGEDYLLASGAQDRYIRLWRLKLNDNIDNSDEDENKLVLLTNKQHKFGIGENKAALSFDALIMGHDDWVSGLQWHPSCSSQSSQRKLQLLSLTADTALMIWEMDEDSGIWVCLSRLGEMSIKGASTATGSSGGFWSCLWIYNEKASEQLILANGKTGAIRAYRLTDEVNKVWSSVLGVTGPIKEVNDAVWSRDGSFLFATSLDQTTRLYAPWVKHRSQASEQEVTWHEFARPQIHGYDMICLDHISQTKFVSGGDEKVLRVFEMTQSISDLLHKFCDVTLKLSEFESLPEAAALPVLGLSNKAANEQLEAGEAQQREEDYEENQAEGNSSKADPLADLEGPPLEDHLQRHTLFPEIEKLYGHGYEISCCATSPSGRLIASACRSNNAKHAVVRVFDVNADYKLSEQSLDGHSLTITSLEFSQDGTYLVAVSRDRQLSLWRVSDEEKAEIELVKFQEKAHSRIVWDCSWAPTCDYGSFFVTASRDKSIKLWKANDNGAELLTTSKTTEPVTSVACLQLSLVGNRLLVAAGQESGTICIYAADLNLKNPTFVQALTFDKSLLPASKVCKLSFSKKVVDKKALLAVASSDTSARIYTISLDRLH